MKLFPIILLLMLICSSYALTVNEIDTSPNDANMRLGNQMESISINKNPNGQYNTNEFVAYTKDFKDVIEPVSSKVKIEVPVTTEYDTSLNSNSISNLLKISHNIYSKPNDLVYTFNYNGKIDWGGQVNYNVLSIGSWYGWNLINNGYENNISYYNYIMFDDGNVFDWSDFNGTTAHFKSLRIEPNKVIVTFSVDELSDIYPGLSYPYILDPTFGNGTIQTCQSSGYDYCNVTISSTITGGDFVLNNRGTTIDSGVTITLSHSRLTINSTEYFRSISTNPFNAQGSTASSPTAGSGGSGGSGLITSTVPSGVNGASNGNSGTTGGGGGCAVVAGGTGSGYAPFDFSSGSAGTYDLAARLARGGGFYATGSVYDRSGICATGLTGGSGHAIKIISSVINLSGTINNYGGSSQTGSTSSVGGSGGGVLTLYGAYIQFNGTYTATGSAGLVGGSCTLCGATGGGGGNFASCSKVNYNNTGSTITLTGGAGAGTGGASGSAGSTVTNSSGLCYPDLIVNPYTNNNSTFVGFGPTLQFNMGLFNSTQNVTCWSNANGTITSIGKYNLTTAVNTYSVNPTFPSAGSYNVNFTCGNSSAGISNVTSSSILVNIIDPYQIDSCRELNVSGSYYMNYSVTSNGSSPCLNLTSSDSIINCGNFSIVGNGSGIGLNMNNLNNVTINNCKIYNFTQDIKLTNNTNISVILSNISSLNISSTQINLSNVTFTPVNGVNQNISNLDMYDEQSSNYLVKWVNVNYSLPSTFYNYVGLGNRSVTITPYTATNITNITFYYGASNLSYLNSSFVTLWRHDGSGWLDLNATLNTTRRSLVLAGLVPASDYVVLSGVILPSLTIYSPSNGSSYFSPILIPYNIVPDPGGFSTCNLTTNGALVGTFNDSYSISSATGVVVGRNNVSASCLALSGSVVNASTYFNYSFESLSDPFRSAFDFDLSTCPIATSNELLGRCTEYYKIPRIFNFSAVPCESLNLSLNYSCLISANISNVTKVGDFANYTIFYTPSYWQYHGAVGVSNKSLQLTGAEFIYNSKFIMHSADKPNGGGMELIDNDSFMYVPAQHKPTDNGYFYTSIYGTNYSYGYGFIVNDRIVAVSDENNQWYTASGVGVSNSSTVSSSPVVYVNVVPLAPAATSPFSSGIYTRSVCSLVNHTYTVNFQNTVSQSYTVFITTNVSGVVNVTSYTVNSTTLSVNTPDTDVISYYIYDSSKQICSFSSQSTLFLNFNFLNGLATDGFSNMFIKILMLFSVALSAVSPYTLVIMFLLNDLYHVLSISDLSTIVAVAAIAGIVNNTSSPSRGIKNIVIVMGVCVGYLFLTVPHIDTTQCSGADFTSVFNSINDFKSVTTDQGLGSQIIGFSMAIVNLFLKLMFLPATIVTLLTSLLICILPATLVTPISLLLQFISYGATMWMWIKGYEVVSNRFRDV